MNITNDLVTEYINHRYQPVNDRLDQLRQLGEQDNVPIILKETETFLNMVLALKRPQKILEVGTAIGYSSLYFAERCQKAEIYTIEKNEYAVNSARHNIAAAGLEHRIHSPVWRRTGSRLKNCGIRGLTVLISCLSMQPRVITSDFFDAAITICEKTPSSYLTTSYREL